MLVQGELQDRDVVVKAALGRDLPLLQVDRMQLQQVILNLVINAAEAMSGVADRERTLRIRSEKRLPADVLLTIEDSGPGIAPESVDLFSRRSTRPKLMAWGWACRFAAPSSSRTAGASRHRTVIRTEPSSNSYCRSISEIEP